PVGVWRAARCHHSVHSSSGPIGHCALAGDPEFGSRHRPTDPAKPVMGKNVQRFGTMDINTMTTTRRNRLKPLARLGSLWRERKVAVRSRPQATRLPYR